jgi:MFS family permease
VNTVGNGLFMTGSAVFFVRSVGLSPAQVGAGLTIAGGVGLVAGIPAGRMADRRGAREVAVPLLLLEASCAGCFALIHQFWAFLLVATGASIGDGASSAVRGALIAGVVPPDEVVRTRAFLRSVTNLGISAGAIGAGVALHADTRFAYVILVLGDALTFALTAAVIWSLGHIRPHAAPEDVVPRAALRDRGYLAVTAVNGVMCLHYEVLVLAMPLWVVSHTPAPRWLVSPLLLVNTVLIVLFQVRASRGAETVPGATRAMRRACVALTVCCGVYAASSAPHGEALAIAILVVAVFVHTLGELRHAAGSWGLSFLLAPLHAQGEYQGVFGLGMMGARALSPAILTLLCITWGVPGWIALGGIFVLMGAAIGPAVSWAQRTRPA